MSYITKEYYDDTFHGVDIPTSEFERLADIASDVVYDVCNLKPDEEDIVDATFKKAVAYETEFLHEQGGVDAIFGFSEAVVSSSGESLGDYSASGGSSEAGKGIQFVNGIPVSPMTIMLLRRLGLMCRWAYAGRRRDHGKPQNPC